MWLKLNNEERDGRTMLTMLKEDVPHGSHYCRSQQLTIHT
jgi:hypothetical protein